MNLLVIWNRFVMVLCLCTVVVIIVDFFRPGVHIVKPKKGEEIYYGPQIEQRGEYWVFYNVLVSKKSFSSYESVTYTTHCDFTSLGNLQPLLERWKGPISVALYAPGYDFQLTIESIHYLRDCTTALIWEFVTFHVFLKAEDLKIRRVIPNLKETFESIYNCHIEPNFKLIKWNETYRALNELTYPINVARNIAKESSETHFVLVSDIEQYPSLNIIENFLEMINRTQIMVSNKNPIVFPLNVFEVEIDSEMPATKTELLELLKNRKAINYHQKMYSECHYISNHSEWINTSETNDFNVFYVSNKIGKFIDWEPFYIGTKNDPNFDERFTWEGKRDKVTQRYILCVQNYDMMILDNAFLVYKPKDYEYDLNGSVYLEETDFLIENVIGKELENLFGIKEGCVT